MDAVSASTEPEPTETAPTAAALQRGAPAREAAETRERIITAGAELLHESSIRNWQALTIRAVAERAGVNERTVYRYFGNERGLRDAVIHRHEEEAGIDLAGMQLDDIADIAARIFEHVSSFPLEPRPPLDPTLAEANQRQRDALLGAVAARTGRWSPEDREVVAAMFDVLWSVASYERLVADWRIDSERAIRGITWVIELVEEAVRSGRGPS